ncbi:MAG: RNA polymerase sigma factor [Clostridia bacterium]|nr:RNA polymerase sigma factor [Clostridia bacterium]MDH7572484.1 RNA polymerase sigma factor [Clostridia bacterium]
MDELQGLVERSQGGDAAALEKLVAILQKKVYRLALSLTGNHADAEDLVQEAVTRVYTRLRFYDPERGSFEVWVHRITTNLWINWAKSRRGLKVCSLDSLTDPDEEGGPGLEIASGEDGPEEEFEKRELRELTWRLIRQLPPKSRAAVALREIGDYAYREIAAALGCSETAVKTRINRGRQILKEKLAQAGYAPGGKARRGGKGRDEG